MQLANAEVWKNILVGETLLFGLLGKALYAELDKDWLESLIAEDIFAEAPFGEEQMETRNGLKCLQSWTAENRAGISDECFKAIKKDQLDLFIGTDKVLAPVWESVYFSQQRLVFQTQTLQVREWFSRFGLQLERFNREPDDHIGLELSFLAHLASLALQALDQDDSQKFETVLQAQRDFLSEHLLCWGPVWARLVSEHAGTDFYRGLAHLTHGALLATAEHLQIGLPKEVSF
jgi:putative dimethyl sulfoxide reductase chaperone